MNPTGNALAKALDLSPHPEGGFYRETFRSDQHLMTARGVRPAATAILFLITAASPSRFHRLVADELWLFHAGAPLELLTLRADGSFESVALADAERLARSELFTPQAIVPAGTWQAARVVPDGAADYTLTTCVVTPGFTFDDFELGSADELLAAYPLQADIIAALV
jgi:predicted cupin superfamily sugar epimerase